MSMSDEALWYVIRRRDIFDYDSISDSIIHRSVLPPEATFEEIKSIVFSWIKIEDNNSKIVKIRRHDHTLIPYSALLQGTTRDKPYIIEVCTPHQFCEAKKKTIPPEHAEAFNTKAQQLQKRVEDLEEKVANYTAAKTQQVEDKAKTLVDQLEFLSRRIDQLTPASWPT